ncbi:MAG: hypothetical protein KIT00_00235 [Rhodospirillales bacterium]|nr:hypothetical protein [Rhodospirillales bacterium]
MTNNDDHLDKNGGKNGESPKEHADLTTNSIPVIHNKIELLHREIEQWERERGVYDWQRDEAGFDTRWKALIVQMSRTPAISYEEILLKLERSINEGGIGSPTGDRLVDSALRDLKRLMVGRGT